MSVHFLNTPLPRSPRMSVLEKPLRFFSYLAPYATIRMLHRGLFAVLCGCLQSWSEFDGWGQKVKMPTENHVPVGKFRVGAIGFEPATPCSQSRCTTGLWKRHPVSGSVSGKKYICLGFFGVVWALEQIAANSKRAQFGLVSRRGILLYPCPDSNRGPSA